MEIKLSYTPLTYKPKQFCELIEKRIKKAIRAYNLDFSKPINILNDDSKEYAVALFLLKKLFAKTLKIRSVKKMSSPLIVPTNMERTLNTIFSAILEDKPLKVSKDIVFMDCLLEEEIIAYAKLNKIPFTNSIEPLNPIIEHMQRKYPETKFSLYNSLKKIKVHHL